MEETNDLMAVRRQKLAHLRDLGVDPFGGRFETTSGIGELRAKFSEDKTVRIAGRLTAHRDMGKSQFCDLSDVTGRMQVYLHAKEIGAKAFEIFQATDLGDFLGVEGKTFITKTGEPTIRVEKLTVLSKALRPLPDKWHGLADVERRYRQRYLDLISNENSRLLFRRRAEIIAAIRSFLNDRGFVEVETPMMQAVAGGAAARPFKTHHNALGLDLYLRIAPELYLKRLLVGGFPKIYELNRNFRNEGISRRHNPEFTMLEVYEAFGDFETMAAMVEEMVCGIAQQIHGTLTVEHKDEEGNISRTINLARPWRRARYHELIREVEPGWFEFSLDEKRAWCSANGVEISPAMAEFEITQQVFEKRVEERTIDPLFVTHLPTELVPLARQNSSDPSLVDVYELIINGVEISPGYTELNDPDVQRNRLEEQAGEEIQNIDTEFLLALEHGMPPAGGIGIGIDRLVMMLTGAESLRDIIFFPQLKPRDSHDE